MKNDLIWMVPVALIIGLFIGELIHNVPVGVLIGGAVASAGAALLHVLRSRKGR
ncbi:MAG: hypothetical protein Q4A88_02660 [Clostridia bacterium]|nr:hypothetical protein [Clostridia bacterium]